MEALWENRGHKYVVDSADECDTDEEISELIPSTSSTLFIPVSVEEFGVGTSG